MKLMSFQFGTAPIWTFRNLKKHITHIRRFAAWKRDSWASENRSLFVLALSISECFAAWILYSWESETCSSAQHLSVRFADLKPNSWTSANRPPCWMALPIYDGFEACKSDSWDQQIEVLPCRHCPNWTFRNLNTRFLSISKTTLMLDGTAHFWTFRNLKTRFLSISNSTSLRTTPSIFERLAAWILDSWETANQSNCWTALPMFERFASWIRNEQNNLIAGKHCPYWNFRTLKTRFLSIIKSALLQDGSTQFWAFISQETWFLKSS